MDMTPRDKRMLQILGVVAALALAYFVFTNVLGGDGGEERALPTGPTGTIVVPTGTPTLTPSPTPRETLPPVVLAGARDPFSIPPGLEPAGGGVAPSPGEGGTGTDTGGPTTGPPVVTTPPTVTTPPFTTPPTTTPPTTTTPPPEPPPNETTIGGHDLRLRDVENRRDRVVVVVDGKVYTVEEGATFDESFKLVKIEGNCARFLFGDQSFTLCTVVRK
jgi:hypothetical protein